MQTHLLSQNTKFFERSHGLVVIAGDSWLKGLEFEFHHQIIDGILLLICCKILLFDITEYKPHLLQIQAVLSYLLFWVKNWHDFVIKIVNN